MWKVFSCTYQYALLKQDSPNLQLMEYIKYANLTFQLTSQVYISEIAHPSIRGSLCSATKVASQIGLLSAFAMGAKFDWRQLALVCAASPVMLLITAQYIPETPSFLLYTNQEEKAEKALQWLRGPDADM